MKKVFKAIVTILTIIILSIESFCLPFIPIDFGVYEEIPLVIASENFKQVFPVYDHDGSNHSYLTYKINEFMADMKFGKYPHKNAYGEVEDDIKWLVLAKGDGKALLVSRDVLGSCPYNTTSDACDFDNSFLKIFLNTTFYDKAFSEKEKKQILNYTPTNSKVFVLSEYELALYMGLKVTPSFNEYASGLIVDKPRIGYYTFGSYKFKSVASGKNYDAGSYNVSYWVRNDKVDKNAKSIFTGKISKKSTNETDGVRPAIWVSYDIEKQKKYDYAEKLETDFIIDKFVDVMTGPFGLVGDLISDGVSPDSWYEYNNNKRYSLTGWSADKYYKNGAVVKNDWVVWDKVKYYVGSNGKIVKNKWIENNDSRSYVNEYGKLLTSQWIDNKYYVDKKGIMLKNTTTPDGHYVDGNGEKQGGTDFNYTLDLDIGIKNFKDGWYYYIKTVKSNSHASKLGLKKGYKIIEINDDNTNLSELFEDDYGDNSMVIQFKFEDYIFVFIFFYSYLHLFVIKKFN